MRNKREYGYYGFVNPEHDDLVRVSITCDRCAVGPEVIVDRKVWKWAKGEPDGYQEGYYDGLLDGLWAFHRCRWWDVVLNWLSDYLPAWMIDHLWGGRK